MKNLLCTLILGLLTLTLSAQTKVTIASPNGLVEARVQKSGSSWHIYATSNKKQVADVTLGFTTASQRYTTGLTLQEATEPTVMVEDYTAVHGKRSAVHNEATATTLSFTTSNQKPVQVEVRAYNDGVAFRYLLPGDGALEFTDEATAYAIPSSAKRWLQRYVTSYEGDYPQQDGSGQTGAWGYPALFQVGDEFALITEGGTHGQYCNTHLDNSANANTYKVAFPYDWEGNGTGEVKPKSNGAWQSPWRLIIMGSLATVFESTLMEDVSPASQIEDTSWIEPASASWVYWAYNHGSRDYQICKQYVDLAIKMKWKYVLIDWEWDVMGNGGNIENIISYAKKNGVKTMLWYNSGGTHNSVGGGPRDRLLTHESRCREFEYLNRLGVAGIKIDFFESDKQNMVQYYLDILEDAAKYKIMIVFHGCTVPRGWGRTWPNLMTMEAVHGAEQYNNGAGMTGIASRLNCTLPFTRNVIGPMDYTPVAFTNSQHPHITSFAHELALSVVFESAVQHWADRPEGFYDLPTAARWHMSAVPTAWDNSRLLQGYPGTDCVVARRSGNTWYVGGLNGETRSKKYTIDFSFLPEGKQYMATIMADGEETNQFLIHSQMVDNQSQLSIRTLSRGGFVIDIRDITYADLKNLVTEARTVYTAAKKDAAHHDATMLNTLKETYDSVRMLTNDIAQEEVNAAFITLSNALSALENQGAFIDGQARPTAASQNITRHYLGEARNFSRKDKGTRRFGTPADWTVENYEVPNGNDGTKNGIDKYAGYNELSLGVWNDAGNSTLCSIALSHYPPAIISSVQPTSRFTSKVRPTYTLPSSPSPPRRQRSPRLSPSSDWRNAPTTDDGTASTSP